VKTVELAICICTYQRPHLLKLLIDDLLNQDRLPDLLLIVDGDPNSGEIQRLLELSIKQIGAKVILVPSNHANLPYQRYLGWRVAQMENVDILIYLDDDLRIMEKEAIGQLLSPFLTNNEIKGVTGKINFVNVDTQHLGNDVLLDRAKHSSKKTPWLVRLVGPSKSTPPGGISSTGNRRMPNTNESSFIPVEWLHGGVMSFRMDALSDEIFSEDLFALTHIRCGVGEDTYLSRMVRSRGLLYFATRTKFIHPNAALPNSYPIHAYYLGHAIAYSRRFINDHIRGFEKPSLRDRVDLVISYFGNGLLAWWRAMSSMSSEKLAYAWGYSRGAVKGLFVKPTARRLTPDIDWWQEADVAMQNVVAISYKESISA
jgi:glycosyltransferase involved in cell wall biosynthesis